MSKGTNELLVSNLSMVIFWTRRFIITSHQLREPAFQPTANRIKAWFTDLASNPGVRLLSIEDSSEALLKTIELLQQNGS